MSETQTEASRMSSTPTPSLPATIRRQQEQNDLATTENGQLESSSTRDAPMREYRVDLFAAIDKGDTQAILAAFDGMRAALNNEMGAVERERDAWRWLHWGQPDAMWACPCGHAYARSNQCDECGTWRPMKPAVLAAVQAGATYDAALVAKHRAVFGTPPEDTTPHE